MSANERSADADHYASIEAYLAYMAANPDPVLAALRNDANGNDLTAINGNVTQRQNDNDKDNEDDQEKKDDEENKKNQDGKYPGEGECQEEIEQWFKEAKEWGKEHGFPREDDKEEDKKDKGRKLFEMDM